MQFNIKKIFEELFNSEVSMAKVLEFNRTTVCIINSDCDGEALTDNIIEKSTYGCNVIRENFFVKVDFTISSPYASLYELSAAFSEAKQACSYKRILNADNTPTISSSTLNTSISYAYPLDLEEKLMQEICQSNFDAAKHIIDVIFESITEDNKSREYINCIIYGIISTLMRVSTSIGMQLDASSLIPPDADPDSAKICILSCIGSMCSLPIKSNTDTLQEKILKYVLEHYTDSDLSVSIIAQHFNMSYSYISMVFNEHYNITLFDFIHRYRLKKANELIETEQYSFAKIAEMVGYNHIRTFNRIYKKYIGVTPTEYKNSL